MAQGFVTTNNLAESVSPSSDRAILDNLGGVNITQDVLLFDGNINFESKLVNDASISRADFEVFDDATELNYKTVRTNLIQNKRAFSNGTLLSFNAGADLYPYIVVDSNGVDEFRVVQISATIPYNAGEYNVWDGFDVSNLTLTRKDAISVDNIVNMSVPRLTLKDVINDAEESGTSGADADESGETGGAGDVGSEIDGIFDNYGTYDQIGYIAGTIGRLEAKKQGTILTDRQSFFDENIRFKGNIRLTNDSQVEIYNNGANAPGLFIYNTATGGEIRAFSGSDNPWEELSQVVTDSGNSGDERTALSTQSDKSQIANLILEPDGGGSGTSERGFRPKLRHSTDNYVPSTAPTSPITKVETSAPANEQLTKDAFTHKVPITINGEQFFILVIEDV